MIDRLEARDAILEMVAATVPRIAWEELLRGAAWAYREAMVSTRNDTRVLPSHARFRAAQDRHFFMETVLARVAQNSGGMFVPEIVESNRWAYGLARFGQFSLMQKKVGDCREPPPAEFRRQVSSANQFIRQGDLFFMDELHARAEYPVQGVIIHAPQSQRFSDDGFGVPAFIRFGVPFGDYSGWVITIDVADLSASYPVAQPPRKGPTPTWKINTKRGSGDDT